MQSWVHHNPDWQYVFWDDVDNDLLIRVFFPEFQQTYRALPSGVAQADFARYALLYQFGGVYADADFECKKPFDDLVTKYDGFLSSEPTIHAKLLENREGVFICNAIMASRAGHPFWMAVLSSIKEAARGAITDPVSLTGPRMVHQTWLKMQGVNGTAGIELLPEEYFYPEIAKWNQASFDKACETITDKNRRECELLKAHPDGLYTNNTHAVHHWQCTWCRGDNAEKYVPLSAIIPDDRVTHPFNLSKPYPNGTEWL
jgi:mannosyltransferase OCH1-like enzyme